VLIKCSPVLGVLSITVIAQFMTKIAISIGPKTWWRNKELVAVAEDQK
jgi:hypothetical protein